MKKLIEEAKAVSTLLDKVESFFHQGGWINVKDSLPKELETVWISNGKGWTTLGCLVYDDGWHWAETNGVIYERDGEIVAEAESDDLDVQFWHPIPKPIKIK